MTVHITQLLDSSRIDDVDQSATKLKIYYYVFRFISPYEEVRASVSNVDDTSLPVETFRAYFLGLVFGGLVAAANQV